MAAKARKRDTCRNRPTKCDGCGYRAYTTRAWLQRGLLTCPCGGELRPTKLADLAFIGLIGIEDVATPGRSISGRAILSQAEWNEICRENGWPIIRNQGQGARVLYESPLGDAPVRVHCAFPGCGMWVKASADRCSAGHPQSDDAPESEAMPF